VLAHSCLKSANAPRLATFIRPLLVLTLVFAGCAYVGQYLIVDHWAVWVLGVAATFVSILGAAVLSGLPAEYRRTVLWRVRVLARLSR
jgi:hypothetical protein